MEGAALCLHWNQSLLKICLSGIGCFCQNQMDSQASSFTIWVFYPALLLNGNLILQQMKCGNGLVFMEVTGLVMFPNTLEQLAWQSDGLATWSISHSTKRMTPPCRVGALPSSMLQTPWINNQTSCLHPSYSLIEISEMRLQRLWRFLTLTQIFLPSCPFSFC